LTLSRSKLFTNNQEYPRRTNEDITSLYTQQAVTSIVLNNTNLCIMSIHHGAYL